MVYTSHYKSRIGEIMLASNGDSLIGLWIKGQKYFAANIPEDAIENNELNIFLKTTNWLDKYFNGEQPSIQELQIAPVGTKFRQEVWKILCKIPYGQTITYGEIAKSIAKVNGNKSMSAQAVGGAVGHNPISIIIPCHRVVGTNGSLTGFAGGIDKKIKLLEHEKVDISIFFNPNLN